MENPTDPDAGTNRTNAVSRDNLMNEASLGYDGYYRDFVLDSISENGNYWSSTIVGALGSYYLNIRTDEAILPQSYANNKYIGRSVRCAPKKLTYL